jgi:predicted transcriptional regulator
VRGRRSCSSSDGEVHASRRSLVFSIAPRWMDEILVLRKTVELRRRPPRIATRVEAYLYETRPECRLRARCLMGPVISAPVQDLWDAVGHKASVTREEFDRYFSGVGLATQSTSMRFKNWHQPSRLICCASLRLFNHRNPGASHRTDCFCF